MEKLLHNVKVIPDLVKKIHSRINIHPLIRPN